jgi:hypothetical protein
MKRTIYQERRPDGKWFTVYHCDHFGTTMLDHGGQTITCTEPGCWTVWLPGLSPLPQEWVEVTDAV